MTDTEFPEPDDPIWDTEFGSVVYEILQDNEDLQKTFEKYGKVKVEEVEGEEKWMPYKRITLIEGKRLWIDWSSSNIAFIRPSFGADEYNNHSIYFNFLWFSFVFFYKREINPRQGWYLMSFIEGNDGWYNDDFNGVVYFPPTTTTEAHWDNYICCVPPKSTTEVLRAIEDGTAVAEYWDDYE